MNEYFARRRDKLKRIIRKHKLPALLITNVKNVTYLTGFTGDDSYLLVTPDRDLILSDPRYEIQITEECPGIDAHIRKPSEQLLQVTCGVLNSLEVTGIGIESQTMTVAMYEALKADTTASLLPHAGLVEQLREIKDAKEIATLQRAIEIAQRVFQSIRVQLRGAQTELEIAHEIEREIRLLGGSGCSFKPIVAVGARAALPHASPALSQVAQDSLLLIDWGATVDGYRSDLTRVLIQGRPNARVSKVYETVLAAQTAAIECMRPGVLVSEVDQAARAVIDRAGMGKHFNHGLGHGIGLDIHETPRLGKNQDRELEPGMVVTVEPGIYYAGWGGVRIEDDVLITRDGCEVLSDLPKQLEESCVSLLN